ncbi:MAG: TSUP family transporter [Pseudomonadota bacterium]
MELLIAMLAMPGLGWVAAGAVAAGVVRGFTGFGTAMIYLPVAATVVDPVTAFVSLVVMDIWGPVPLVPRAWRDAARRDLALLTAGVVLMLPVGITILSAMTGDTYRWVVGIGVFCALAAMLSGVRYPRPLTVPVILGTGGIGGFLGGASGHAGPPVVVLYMASTLPPQTVRATLLLFLIIFDLLVLPVLWWRGDLEAGAVVLGAVLVVPYGIAGVVGQRFFRPEAERTYRAIAYLTIAASALVALPIWR